MKFNSVEEYFQYFQSLSVEEQFHFCEHQHPDIIGETNVDGSSVIHYHDCSIEEYDKQVGAVTPEQLLRDLCHKEANAVLNNRAIMTEEDKEGIEHFDELFRNTSLHKFYEWMQNQDNDETETVSELEFEELDCSVDEYIKSENLILPEDLDTIIATKRNKYKPQIKTQ